MNASCSMFSQILKLIPRTDFQRIVQQTGAEYRSKGLSSWSQFVAMLFCQLGRAHSLREVIFKVEDVPKHIQYLWHFYDFEYYFPPFLSILSVLGFLVCITLVQNRIRRWAVQQYTVAVNCPIHCYLTEGGPT